MIDKSNMKICTSQNQYQKIYSYLVDIENIAKSYLPGCKRTTILAVSESTGIQPESFMMIRIFYQPETFTEIYNTEAVGFESFWGGVGGFVGIFLGFSLMQIPDLISFKNIRDYINNL